jgi:AcrR family transcriptional regulator
MPRIRAANIEAHKERTRSDILKATQVLLAEMGAGDLSVGAVAAEVGIGRTTIYEYFVDKEDLIASLVEELLPELIREMLSTIPPHLPAKDRLARLVNSTVEFVATDPVLGLILHRDLPRLGAVAQDRILLAHRDLVAEFAAIYRQGVEEGSFHRIPSDLASRFVQDAMMSAARALIVAPDPQRRLPEVLDALNTFLFEGLATD